MGNNVYYKREIGNKKKKKKELKHALLQSDDHPLTPPVIELSTRPSTSCSSSSSATFFSTSSSVPFAVAYFFFFFIVIPFCDRRIHSIESAGDVHVTGSDLNSIIEFFFQSISTRLNWMEKWPRIPQRVAKTRKESQNAFTAQVIIIPTITFPSCLVVIYILIKPPS